MHQLLGLSAEGLTKIVITTKPSAESTPLFTPDEALWDRLRVSADYRGAEEGETGQRGVENQDKPITLWMCGENDRCMCCYCIKVGSA
jgi:hypothetical protein